MFRNMMRVGVVLAAVMLVASVASAIPPKSAHVVVKEGDAMGAATVSTVNAPFTDGNGKVGFVGSISDSQRFVWWDTGPVFLSGSALPDVLTGGEGTMGIGNNGEFIYSPSVNGNDAVWGNNGLILQKGDPAPDLPAGWNNTFNSRPQMVDDGTGYWIAGFDDTGGTSTKGRVLYRQAQGGAIQAVLRSDDVINGETIARSSGVDFDYSLSGSGTSMINVLQMATGSTADDDRVLVNGVFVAGETWPTGQGDNWDNFDAVGINDSGNYVFSGDTDGATTNDEFIAYNGAIAIREGDIINGITLGSSVNAASINELDQVAFIWASTPSETLFFGDGAALSSAVALLSVADEIDVDGDLIADYAITDFNASAGVIGPGLDLAEDGYVYVDVDMIPVTGGTEIQAIIRVAIPEPASLLLMAVGGLALIRRR